MQFGELVGLMVWGTGKPDALRGVVREVDDGEERRYRIARRGALFRRENLDGVVDRLQGEHASWFRDENGVLWMREDDQERRRYTDTTAPIGGLDVGGPRPSWARWTGTDFTRPTGPVTATEFLGRPAWAVELAPPSHKPYPLQLVVDAATGLLLREANRDFGTLTEYLEFEPDADLPDSLFTYDGDARPVPTRDEREAEHEAELAQRTAWLAERGLATLPLTAEVETFVYESDDSSGAFYAGFEASLDGSLLRRPLSDAYWDEPDTTSYPHTYRWSDGRWDWFLGIERPLGERGLAALQERLAAST